MFEDMSGSLTDLLRVLVIVVAATVGGALNSVAGGGSFLTFPALIAAGIGPIAANATSTVALWPGALASIGAYRREFASQSRLVLWLLVSISLIGGGIGALLLLITPQRTFVALVPYLLLVATLLFIFSKPLVGLVRARFSLAGQRPWVSLVGVACLQLIIGIYGGYFGGGIGILMLAALAILGMEHMHTMNALKTLLGSCINGVAVLIFVFANVVSWPQALVMIAGAIVGGYGGAAIARRLDPELIRRFVIVVAVTTTVIFFLRS